jgi:uncharacterized membrane protein
MSLDTSGEYSTFDGVMSTILGCGEILEGVSTVFLVSSNKFALSMTTSLTLSHDKVDNFAESLPFENGEGENFVTLRILMCCLDDSVVDTF